MTEREEKGKKKEEGSNPHGQFVLFEAKQVSAGVAGLDKLAARLAALSASGDDRATDLVRRIARKLGDLRAMIDKFAPEISREMAGIARKYSFQPAQTNPTAPVGSSEGQSPASCASGKQAPQLQKKEGAVLVVAETDPEVEESFLKDFDITRQPEDSKK